MQHDMFYNSENFILCPLEAEDIEELRLLRNRPENRKWFFYDKEIDMQSQKKWYEKYLKTPDDYIFSVKSENDFIGIAAIYPLEVDELYSEDTNLTFEVGRLLLDSEKKPKPHMGVELISSIVEVVKHYFGNCVLTAQVYEDNRPSLNSFKKNGFKEFGRNIVNNREVLLLRKSVIKE